MYSTVVGDVVKFVLRLTKDGVEYVRKNGALTRISEYLSTKFCSDFVGSTDIKEADETIDILSEEVFESELEKIEYRTIKVKDVITVDDSTMGNVAIYIEDANAGDVTICGTVTEITEKTTKNGKPFFIIHLDDTTGRTSGVYFTKKNTYHLIKGIVVGDTIICSGKIGEYNGKRSFTIDKINRCTFPSDFVKKEKFKKGAPKEYRLIFPSPATTIKIKSVFDRDDDLPKELTDKVYVVFDLETTGFDFMNHGITEIGAVKLIEGKVVEQFTTLVKPDYRISADNESVTGISEEMVKDAPKIGAVLPDFMKFIDGATLVGHNAVDFDMKFVKRFVHAEGYEVKNPVIDTMSLGRETLRMLKHHDLHTIADHFGIAFHHHRALSDSYATAEIFIEMMKIKYKGEKK